MKTIMWEIKQTIKNFGVSEKFYEWMGIRIKLACDEYAAEKQAEIERLRSECRECLIDMCNDECDMKHAERDMRRALNLVNRFRCESCGAETSGITVGVPCECGGEYDRVVTVEAQAGVEA